MERRNIKTGGVWRGFVCELNGYDKFDKDRGRLSCRSVWEMEGGKGAILTAHGCLSVCTVECAG
jgi:hypothetical protein